MSEYFSGQVLHGFRLERCEFLDEISSEALVFEHEKTGASVLFLVNDDDHCSFMTSFRTPSENSTGVAHILEHSVLNGSENYPVKEPFVELLKSSLYTFLNAFTYPDRTVYPVASRNQQDLTNLIDVYLDAVFHPRLSRQTFLQEGWRYLLDSANGELRYSGVVYNEMRGVEAEPENQLVRELDRFLFPQSLYGQNSGGDPAHIPDLSYAEFQAFHRRYYHPSNSLSVFYGQVDVAFRLQQLNGVFADFSRMPTVPPVTLQPRFSQPRRHQAGYPIAPGESLERRAFHVRGYLLEPTTDADFCLSTGVLAQLLSGTPGAPLTRALIDSHLGDDVVCCGFENDIFDTYYSVGIKGAEADAGEAFEEVVDTCLQTLADDGIDPRTVEAALNTIEFQLREAQFGSTPRGVVFGCVVLSSWSYGGDPLARLRFEAPLRRLRKRIRRGKWFEAEIRRLLLDNAHRVTLSLVPDAELAGIRARQEATRLAAVRQGMSAEKVQQIHDENAALEAAQKQPDSPEDLAKLPHLPLSCVARKGPEFPFQIVTDDSAQLSFSEQATSGIVYLTLAFDARSVPAEDLPWLPLLARVLLHGGSRQRHYVEVLQDFGIYTGGIQAACRGYTQFGDAESLRPLLQFEAKVLTAKTDCLFDLLREILADSRLDDVPRLRELTASMRASMERALVSAGHRFAALRLNATSSAGAWRHAVSGVGQFDFLQRAGRMLERDPERAVMILTRLRRTLIRRSALHVHCTGKAPELQAVKTALGGLLAVLDDSTNDSAAFLPPPAAAGAHAYCIPGDVQYVGRGCNILACGQAFNGQLDVVETVLSRDYLWNRVRAQGGAYGCFLDIDPLSGNLVCVSYRDPNLDSTLQAYAEIADFLENPGIDQDEFEKRIISTVGGLDTPHSPQQKGTIALERYFSGLSTEQIQEWRNQTLTMQVTDLGRFAPLFRHLAEAGNTCVFGAAQAIRAAQVPFDSVRTLFDGGTTDG